MRVGTHSLASSIVFLVFFIVTNIFDSIIDIKTLRTVATCNGGGGWHAQHVGDTWGRAAEMASVFVERIRARCASGEPADGQPVASDSSTAAAKLLT